MRSSATMRRLGAYRFRALGVAFLALVVLFVYLTYAVFTKQFADYDRVRLLTSNIGLQLPLRADVKIRGVIVGEVLETETTGDGVEVTLGIYPGSTELIPENVTASILPKTLFGEKYVQLETLGTPAEERIAAGDTIEQTQVAIEVEKVLKDLFPLLRTVQPAELNYTLTAMSTALEGRGELIGENLETLDDYLRRTNPQIPLLIDDLRKLGQVSDVYRDVVPEVARFLDNSVRTGRTFVEQEQKIQALFTDLSSFSSTTRDFLQQNGDNIIRLSELGAKQLPLLAKYSPQYPCMFEALTAAIPRYDETFRDRTLHIVLETIPRQPRGYTPADDPAYNERRGPFPYCNLLDKAMDGFFGQDNLPPDVLVPQLNTGVQYPLDKERVAPSIDLTSGFAGTAAERAVVNGIAAQVLGIDPSEVPDVTSLLFGPLARGTEVSLR